MKYISNAFAASMINEGTVKFEKISKEMFINAGKTSKSIIGHPEIAQHFNLELNRESITLEKGDVLFVVTPSKRPMEGKMVEDGAKYQFITEDEGYEYRKITVVE